MIKHSLFVGLVLASTLSWAAEETMKFKSSEPVPVQSSVIVTTPESRWVTPENQSLSTTNFTPAKGAPALFLAPSTGTETMNYAFPNFDFTRQKEGLVVGLGLALRFSEKMTFEARTDLGNQEVEDKFNFKGQGNAKNDYHANGMSDLHLVLRRMMARDDVTNMHVGADLGLSNAESEWGNAQQDGNRTSGGNSLTPFLSYETLKDGKVLGWKASFDIKNDRAIRRRDFDPKSTAVDRFTESGGNILAFAAFAEKKSGKNVIGAQAKVSAVSSSEWDFSDNSKVNLDPYQTVGLTGYMEIPVAERTTLLPSVGFKTILGSTGTVDQDSAVNLGLAARISL